LANKARGFCEQTYAKPDCYCKSGPLWDVPLALMESGLSGGRRAGRLYRARPERSTFLFLWDRWNTFMAPTHNTDTTPHLVCFSEPRTILTHFYYWLCAKGGKNDTNDKNNSCFMRDTSSCRMLLYLTQQQFHRHEHNRYFPELFMSHYPAASQRIRENTNVETGSVQDVINIYG